jgi:glycosyltransferase involved in cell wall biosynthesis
MPVFNGGAYLKEAVSSILGQTFGDFEFVIVDDGSTDGSLRTIESFSDKRIRIVAQEHAGLVRSLNRALHIARGPYVARMDADDVALPDRIARQVAFLERNADVAVVSSNAQLIDSNGCGLGKSTAFHRYNRAIRKALMKLINPIIHSTVMFRREVVLGLGGYDEFFAKSQDYDLWLRVSDRHRIVCLPEVFGRLRKHGANLSHGDEQGVYGLTALILHRASPMIRRPPTEEDKRRCLVLCEQFHQNRWKVRREAVHELKTRLRKRSVEALRFSSWGALYYRLRSVSCVLDSEVTGLLRLFLAEARSIIPSA